MNKCSQVLLWSTPWIGYDVTGSFHDKFEVKYVLYQMIKDDVLTKVEVFCDWNRYEIMLP
jgi:hypothetical protein